jgi:beta-xylosidase
MADGRSAGAAPVYPGDFPDPHVVRDGSQYYAYATNAGGANVQVLTSPDLVTWEHLGDALPRLPPWARAGFTWAPEVCRADTGWVLYYTVREPSSGRQCISVATAGGPQGPFVDRSAGPLVFQPDRGGSIDPSPFADGDGRWLLWKSDDNALGRASSLWARRLTADGLHLVGEPIELLRHDRGWERPLIEAPSILRRDDTYYLFYSANWWESGHYAIGYATGPSPLGPFTKATRWRPWVRSHGSAAGPGGQAFFTDVAGAQWMAYHAWTRGRVGYGAGGARALWLARVDFEAGRPVLQSET